MINEMSLLEKSAFFAKLSNYVYGDVEYVHAGFKEYNTIFYTSKGADVYVLENDTDVIIVCRGTEVKQFSDIKADVSISRVKTSHGKLHIGFLHYVNHIWLNVLAHAAAAKNEGKNVWVTGHSLGAAMATIISYRLCENEKIVPAGLFTYGSPRVGDRTFINYFNTLPFKHHRWVNDGDIVTKIPFAPFFYHCGSMHHIASSGKVTLEYERTFNPMKLLGLTSPRGIINTIMGDAKDHSSDKYRIFLTAAAS